MSGWDDPETPLYYESFCRHHSRYTQANAALIAHAHIAPGMRMLDLAAGTGRTAEAALGLLGDHGRIVCVEPSAPMRTEGARRISDARVAWRATLLDATGSDAGGPFDRILCGAAIWQLEPLDATILTLSGLLRRGGALCFNIPALYLLEPDDPGGGDDPLLLDLPAALATNAGAACDAAPQQGGPPLGCDAIGSWLRAAGLRAHAWTFRLRLTQEAYAAWLKIPAVAGRLLADLALDERARRIDAALGSVDRASWKWERWRGWTAWKG
jgi:SAM-dependent methyltransferase